MRKNLILALFTAAAVTLLAPQSFAVDLGVDDFSETLSGSEIYTSRVITPDNLDPGGTVFCFGGAPGCFPSSPFDLFGITNRDVLFDVADDSNSTFLPDSFGIVAFDYPDGDFFAVEDLENDDNPGGTGTATWTFDVSGHNNLSMSLDLAAIGNFDTGDDFKITAVIDGGTPQVLYDIQHTKKFYDVTMAGGTTYDTYFTDFYDGDEFDAFCPLGPGVGNCTPGTYNVGGVDVDLDFHSRDFDLDGLVEEATLNDPALGVRAYEVTNVNGTFDEQQLEGYADPLAVNAVGGDANGDGLVNGADFLILQRNPDRAAELLLWDINFGTVGPAPVQLNNDFQTIAVPITDTGSVLTLTYEAAQNGGKEVFTMDNLLITGDVFPLGGVGAVPEPTSVTLFGLGLVLAPLALRRRA